MGIPDKDFKSLSMEAGTDLRRFILEAATGVVPSGKEVERKRYKAHAQRWFKTARGGQELATKTFQLGCWPVVRPQLLPFCNAVRRAVGLDDVTDVSL